MSNLDSLHESSITLIFSYVITINCLIYFPSSNFYTRNILETNYTRTTMDFFCQTPLLVANERNWAIFRIEQSNFLDF
ncbi:hypothetical protein BGV54_24855 [Burkholderia ubonensis]|nr:hypothetical protein WK64_06555 [Burkholderia ubonensis]OJB14811.1 hypothetical protein BGV54_24855 [Burkholderia ubonensis]